MLYRWKQEHLDELEIQTNPGAPSPKAMAEELSSWLFTRLTAPKKTASESGF